MRDEAVAAAQGVDAAVDSRLLLFGVMTPEQIAEAQAKSAEWWAKHNE